MASVDECRQALTELAAKMAANADQVRNRVNLDRTLACRITDLGAAFHGRIADGRLVDLADGDDPKAKIALNTSSDDLLRLVRGELDLPKALAARRVSLQANPLDLLKLRKLL
ncbi:SCP2 sterol-binding domain-containing protein [Solwaraspora sp. WMMD1047]|uniref:SCP2 sterol-binding domain-containing protein n=1 Tax=Solwaraspora sp. WMMD1047 TaxID=3016102 RepID=UPI002417DC60|nr:SCP2 sterol-binding domain-containing protein [Solwaraspora sp. WMMD1047]MDG4830522.1 SCP2 sterol-binding domain-containing protein [Solwaraspora sp. WMMD1047]